MMSNHPEYDMSTKEKLLDFLLSFITPHKKNLFDEIIKNRTRYITIVIEDVFQPHNASAILRTCDCFGVQDIHIIENKNTYNINPDVALGSSKWVNIIKYNDKENNTLNCLNQLKKQGYKVVATTPHKDSCMLENFMLDKKTAFVFGTELNGLSDIATKNADVFVKIPMYGFTESFNISVSVAIILFYLTEKLRKSGINWKFSKEEIMDVKLNWARNVLKKPDLLEKKFLTKLK